MSKSPKSSREVILRLSGSALRNPKSFKMGTAVFFAVILLAIVFPPAAVLLTFGCTVEFWVCLILTLLGYIPGIIYALYAITRE
ncbi:hydrophobic protein RCI2B-like [Raphanus sativus]|uniref:Hydrophobic protein RCI2B-like n=1 Tax=Raphanus sativus TaxID=3726 RepID=A0A6J0LVI2_RAPSA|nr:hydrophobic protein RCI2B-like [Raphanus sativus]